MAFLIVLLSCEMFAGASQSKLAEMTHMGILQFNPHVECYLPDFGGRHGCKRVVFQLIESLLLGRGAYSFPPYGRLDFAGIDYTGSSHGLAPPRGWENITNDCSLGGDGDDVTLLYNAVAWVPLRAASRGCMGRPDKHVGGFTRPYIVQAFRSTESPGFEVLVVAGHFPHPTGPLNFFETSPQLHKAVAESAEHGVHRVVIIADTNFASDKNIFFRDDWQVMNSARLLGAIGVPNHNTQTTSGLLTCCEPWWAHKGYDRIIANFGKHMATDVGFNISMAQRLHSRSMHLPVVGTLTL